MKEKDLISESAFRKILSEEAARFKKKLTLESEKKQLLKKLNEMYKEECETEEGELEEGIFSRGPKTPEEAIEKGKVAVSKNPTLVRALKLKPELVPDMNKFYMYMGYNPNSTYRKWFPNLKAPDNTLGYYATKVSDDGGQETGL